MYDSNPERTVYAVTAALRRCMEFTDGLDLTKPRGTAVIGLDTENPLDVVLFLEKLDWVEIQHCPFAALEQYPGCTVLRASMLPSMTYQGISERETLHARHSRMRGKEVTGVRVFMNEDGEYELRAVGSRTAGWTTIVHLVLDKQGDFHSWWVGPLLGKSVPLSPNTIIHRGKH